MVTTRAATGSLPARPERRVLTAKTSGKSQQASIPYDSKAVVGEDDKISRLPLEVLVDIFSHCHPKSLLHRTSSSLNFIHSVASNLAILNAYSRTYQSYYSGLSFIETSQAVWHMARQGQTFWSVYLNGKFAALFTEEEAQQAHEDRRHPRKLELPEPGPYWSEMVSLCSVQ